MTDSEYLTNELSRSTQNILDVSVSRVLGFSKTVQKVVPEQKTNEPNAVKTSSSNMYKLWWYASSYHQKVLHTVSSRKKTPLRKEKTNSLSFETATQAKKIGAQWLDRSNSDTTLHTFSFAQANGHTHRATIGG